MWPCRSETEAIDFVGSSAERLWALVVFDSGPDDQGAGIILSLYHCHAFRPLETCMLMQLSDISSFRQTLLMPADYTIRMNFTTVPRTWIPVNKWRHSVPIHYKVIPL